MKTTRLARRLGLDGNPLRRRTDKIAAFLAALLVAVFLIGAPLLSVVAVGWAGRAGAVGQGAERSWLQVPAVLLQARAAARRRRGSRLFPGPGPVEGARRAAADRSDPGQQRPGRWPHGPAVGVCGGVVGRSSAQSPGGADSRDRRGGGCRCRPCDRDVVPRVRRALGAWPAPARRLGSGMGRCRPRMGQALPVAGLAAATRHGASIKARNAYVSKEIDANTRRTRGSRSRPPRPLGAGPSEPVERRPGWLMSCRAGPTGKREPRFWSLCGQRPSPSGGLLAAASPSQPVRQLAA